MRIGIVINTSWNIYNFRKGLIKRLLEEGHEVVAIAPRDDFSPLLEQMGCEYQAIRVYRKSSNPISDLRLVYDLYKVYTKSSLDIVLHFTIKPNIYGSVAAALAGIPVINNVTGLGTVFLRENYKSYIAKTLYRYSFRLPKVVFFQNQDDRKIFLQQALVSEKITDLLPGSGVDIHHFSPVEQSDNEANQSSFTFLLVARLLYDKGILEYVDAIRKLRKEGRVKAKFQLLGDIENAAGLGIPLTQVKTWQQEGLLEYLGRVADVRPYIAKADCVVLPSYREGTPRSLLEAASMGKPLVATDVPGCKEVVYESVNGYLCPAKDAEGLANALEKMWQTPQSTLEEFRKNSRTLAVSQFDQQIVINKYFQAIYQCLNRKYIPKTSHTSISKIPHLQVAVTAELENQD
ncbi:glycosyltransferase family 4 protein [Rapidithrix thailandica]|uniref:Glycosyltransferase family 4 protein n=1 Tax=Rapidithrix thailandica TaxID=413964 RepID=A0AAW9SC35_9BACT